MARSEYETAIKLSNDNPDPVYYFELSQLLAYHFKEIDLAKQYYTKAIDLGPELADVELEKVLSKHHEIIKSPKSNGEPINDTESSTKIVAQFNGVTCRKYKDKSNYVALLGELTDADLLVRTNSIELNNSVFKLIISGITNIEYLDSDVVQKCSFNYIKIDFNYFVKKPMLWNDDLSILIYKYSFWGGKPTAQIYNRLVELIESGEFQLNEY